MSTNSTLRIYRGYKTELQLNKTQQTLCRKHAGCARFAYNWGLHRKITAYAQTGTTPTAMELHRELNQHKKTAFAWMYEVSKCAPQETLRNLDQAFRHFFRRVQKGGKPGFPKFKSRKQGYGSFRLTGVIRVFPDAIQLPRLGHLRLKERGYLPTESEHVHILSATVSEKAGRWFVALQVQELITVGAPTGPAVGVDLGFHQWMTISDGTVITTPRALARRARQLRRVQRQLARQRRGSRNSAKTWRCLQRLHARIRNRRQDVVHKTTTRLAKTKSIIVVEDLHVAGIQRYPHLGKVVAEVVFGEVRRQLAYKTRWYGSMLVVAPRFFPSSKRCSRCGQIKERLSLSTRVYRCGTCGFRVDRDLNASYNLVQVAASWAETLNACREVGGDSPSGQCPSMTQEPNTSRGLS